MCCARLLSHVRLFVTPWTAARQAPLSLGFSRQEYWSGLPCPPPGDLPNPGIEPRSPALQVDSLPTELPGKPIIHNKTRKSSQENACLRLYQELQSWNSLIQSTVFRKKHLNFAFTVHLGGCSMSTRRDSSSICSTVLGWMLDV